MIFIRPTSKPSVTNKADGGAIRNKRMPKPGASLSVNLACKTSGRFANPDKYYHKPIPLPEGTSEAEFMSCVMSHGGWERGIYFPWLNDCQGTLDKILRECGVDDPPRLPFGRTNIDENFTDGVRNTVQQAIEWWSRQPRTIP